MWGSDLCSSKNQRLEVDDEFNSYFFMRIVQFYVDNIFVQRTELWLILKTIWFDAAFARIVLYLPLLYVSGRYLYLLSEIHRLYI